MRAATICSSLPPPPRSSVDLRRPDGLELEERGREGVLDGPDHVLDLCRGPQGHGSTTGVGRRRRPTPPHAWSLLQAAVRSVLAEHGPPTHLGRCCRGWAPGRARAQPAQGAARALGISSRPHISPCGRTCGTASLLHHAASGRTAPRAAHLVDNSPGVIVLDLKLEELHAEGVGGQRAQVACAHTQPRQRVCGNDNVCRGDTTQHPSSSSAAAAARPALPGTHPRSAWCRPGPPPARWTPSLLAPSRGPGGD